MSNLRIAEFSGLGKGVQSTDIVIPSGAAYIRGQSLAIGAGQVNGVLSPNTTYARLTAEAPCSVGFAATSASLSVVAGGWYLTSGQVEWVSVTPGWIVGTITDAG
jgi:hypothetical protein